MIKNIAIITSGGDAHGMNSIIRAIGKTALNNNINVYGVYDAYMGLVKNNIIQMKKADFANISHQAGTIIKTKRLPEFDQEINQNQAVANLKKYNIDILFVIGGDGSYLGAYALAQKGIKVITIPGTIDRDVFSSKYSIGFDSALNKIVDAIDNIRDTALSHSRIHLVETMGRHCGDLTLMAGLATGADFVSTTEKPLTYDQIKTKLQQGIKAGKKHQIVVVTEFQYDLNQLAADLEKDLGQRVKPTIIGAIQRGGKPSAFDRISGARIGYYALEQAIAGKFNIAITFDGYNLDHIDLKIANQASKNQFDVGEAHKIINQTS